MSLPPDPLRLTEFGRPIIRYVGPGFQNFNLDASNDALEFIYQSGANWPITRLGVRQGSTTGTAPTYRISLQGVTTGGIPDGTIKASGNAYADYTPTSGNNNTFQWFTLGSSYTPTLGEILTTVVTYQSGTINGSNYCSFSYEVSNGNMNHTAPFAISNNAGSRNRQSLSPVFGVGGAMSDQVYGLPVSSATNGTSYTLTSTPDEHALRFRIPPSLASSAVVAGITWWGSLTTSTEYEYLMRLYSDSGSLVSSITRKNLYHSANHSGSSYSVLFNQPWPRIYAGDWYRLSLAPQHASMSIGVSYIETASADDMHAFPLGTDMHASHRTNEGAWTDVPTRRIWANLLLADMTPAEAPRSRAVRLRR